MDEVVLRQQMRSGPLSPWRKACLAVRHKKPTDREMDTLGSGRVLSAAEPTVDGLHTFHDISPRRCKCTQRAMVLRYPDVGVPGGADVGVTRVREETKLMWPTMPSKEFFVPSRPRWARLNPH